MYKKKLWVALASLLSLSGCQHQSVQGAYATPSKQVEGVALGLTVAPVIGPLMSGSMLGSAATGAYLGDMMGAMTARQRLIDTLVKDGVQVIVQGDCVRLILSADRFFYPGLPTLNPQQYPTLDYIAALLKEYGRTPVQIAAYTDAVASTDQANRLTQQRADSVLGYLWVHGIEYSHMNAAGHGARHPVANNDTVHGSALNRRVEITLRAGRQA